MYLVFFFSFLASLAPRCLDVRLVFTIADHDLLVTDVVWSVLQLCGDDITDLLYEPVEGELIPKLTVHVSKSRNRAFVRGAVHMRVDCFEDAMVSACSCGRYFSVIVQFVFAIVCHPDVS